MGEGEGREGGWVGEGRERGREGITSQQDSSRRDYYPHTLRMPPSKVNINFPLNCPSAMSSSYLLQGPRLGS